MRKWWLAGALAFLVGLLLVVSRTNPVAPTYRAAVGGGGGTPQVVPASQSPRDHVGAAHLAATRAQQALVRGDRALALTAIGDARHALGTARDQLEPGAERDRLEGLIAHTETLETMVRENATAATTSARSLTHQTEQVYNRLAGLPSGVFEPTPTPAPAAAVPATPARVAPAPTPGATSKHLAEAQVHAVEMQAWLEQEKYRNAWKAQRKLRQSLGQAYQGAPTPLARRLEELDRQVIAVEQAPRTQMVARMLVIRRDLDAAYAASRGSAVGTR